MTENDNQNPEQQTSIGNSKMTLIVGAVLIVLIGGFAAWSLLKEEPKPKPEPPKPIPVVQSEPEPEPQITEPDPEPEPEPEPESEPAPPPPPKIVLPELEQSDDVVYKELTDLSWHHDFAALFVNKDIIRHFVVFVDNMAAGNIVRDFSALKPPIGRFKVQETNTAKVIDEASFERYDIYMAVITSTQPEDMVALYKKYQPLVKQVYDELGYPDQDFNSTFIKAIDHILDTPIVEGRIEVVAPKVMYEYKNPEWQSLSQVQRQVLRLGADNVKKLKTLLRRYRALLAKE